MTVTACRARNSRRLDDAAERGCLSDSGIASVQVNAFKSDADTAISESDSAFQARVNRAPRPSSS